MAGDPVDKLHAGPQSVVNLSVLWPKKQTFYLRENGRIHNGSWARMGFINWFAGHMLFFGDRQGTTDNCVTKILPNVQVHFLVENFCVLSAGNPPCP